MTPQDLERLRRAAGSPHRIKDAKGLWGIIEDLLQYIKDKEDQDARIKRTLEEGCKIEQARLLRNNP